MGMSVPACAHVWTDLSCVSLSGRVRGRRRCEAAGCKLCVCCLRGSGLGPKVAGVCVERAGAGGIFVPVNVLCVHRVGGSESGGRCE